MTVAMFVVPVAGLAMLSAGSRQPEELGVADGKLRACPDSPNCVSSQATNASQRVEPFAWPPAGERREPGPIPASTAIQYLADVVAEVPRGKVIRQTDNYLHAEFTSLIFRFVDDVEFFADDGAGVVQVRSASRVGRSDLGANRRRVETLRAKYHDRLGT